MAVPPQGEENKPGMGVGGASGTQVGTGAGGVALESLPKQSALQCAAFIRIIVDVGSAYEFQLQKQIQTR